MKLGFFGPTANNALTETLRSEGRQILGPQLGSTLAGLPIRWSLLHWLSAGEFHNSMLAQLSPSLSWVASPYSTNYTRVNTVLPHPYTLYLATSTGRSNSSMFLPTAPELDQLNQLNQLNHS